MMLGTMSKGALEAIVGRELGRPARVLLERSSDWDLSICAPDCELRLHPEAGAYDLLLGSSLLSATRERREGDRRGVVESCRQRLRARFPGFASQAGRLRGLDDEAVVRRVRWDAARSEVGDHSALLPSMPVVRSRVTFDDTGFTGPDLSLEREWDTVGRAARRFRDCFTLRHLDRGRAPSSSRPRVGRDAGAAPVRIVLGIDASSVGPTRLGAVRFSRRFAFAVLRALGGVDAELHAVAFLDGVESTNGGEHYRSRMATLCEPGRTVDGTTLARLDRAIAAQAEDPSAASATTVQFGALLDLAAQATRSGTEDVYLAYFSTRGLGPAHERREHWQETARTLDRAVRDHLRDHAGLAGVLGVVPEALCRYAPHSEVVASFSSLQAAGGRTLAR